MERVAHPPASIARTAGLAIDSSARARPSVLSPLVLRLSLGAVFFAHGAQKLFGAFGGAGLRSTAEGFAAMGLRPSLLLALVAGVLEFVGSLMLTAGLFTRVVAGLLGAEMLIALVRVHAPNGFFLNWSCAGVAGHGLEYNLVLVGALAALVALGAGRASLDGSRRGRRRTRLPFGRR